MSSSSTWNTSSALYIFFLVDDRACMCMCVCMSVCVCVCKPKQEIETSANLFDIQSNFAILWDVFAFGAVKREAKICKWFFCQSLFYARTFLRLDGNYMKWFYFEKQLSLTFEEGKIRIYFSEMFFFAESRFRCTLKISSPWRTRSNQFVREILFYISSILKYYPLHSIHLNFNLRTIWCFPCKSHIVLNSNLLMKIFGNHYFFFS